MSDIPEDIEKTAAELINRWAANPVAHGLRDSVARAILAERERCAQIAEGYGGGDYWGKATPIAAAIRSPERAGE